MTYKLYLKEFIPSEVSEIIPGSAFNYSVWSRWLSATIPQNIDERFRANARHHLQIILVGLEMKFGLIIANRDYRNTGVGHGLLYEPYLWNLILETSIATYSLVEGLGVALYLEGLHGESTEGLRIDESDWASVIKAAWMPDYIGFDDDLAIVRRGRNRIYQNDLSAPIANFLDIDPRTVFPAVERILHAVFGGCVKSAAFLPDSTNLFSPHNN
ncbi:hypothetical protein SAMN05444339_101147 [Loktanella atrilutea]|uniref:Uncharacterized protein n=1 Tax=Loktanella atrilutea TaxID=366533 RepID=A0A1M4SUQ3_LOKAT|nr:hypothetical protein [Loktanella atrilutea]SHE35943.1 hypothetical protein SAMN05444339_101147 [Loktanella atrilutea]